VVPWKLPLIVAAIVVPIIAAFAVAGPGLGFAVGALVAVAILVVAARQRPRGPIVSSSADDALRHLLVVVSRPVEDATAVRAIADRAVARGGEAAADVLVLAPARIGFLDRWTSDLEPARQAAQRNLVISVAALAKVGVAAEARVGDEDLVQAVEDQLRSFPATEVVLATGEAGTDPAGDAAAAELESRLRAGFSRVVVRDPAAG
jgi:hypothetical protein